tara:strand:+ start:1033 stop:1161 length:129 start_codon:yes stop_codon:yes gene_type:complete
MCKSREINLDVKIGNDAQYDKDGNLISRQVKEDETETTEVQE